MPGFNYGGYGDGTGWSSESGGPAPGIGMHVEIVEPARR